LVFYEETSNVFAFGLFSPSELKLKKKEKRKKKKPHTLPLKILTIVVADPKKGKENL